MLFYARERLCIKGGDEEGEDDNQEQSDNCCKKPLKETEECKAFCPPCKSQSLGMRENVANLISNRYSQILVQIVVRSVSVGWSEWENWTTCPVTCGAGQQVSVRHCRDKEKYQERLQIYSTSPSLHAFSQG